MKSPVSPPKPVPELLNPVVESLSTMLMEAMNREANLRAQLIAALRRVAEMEAAKTE